MKLASFLSTNVRHFQFCFLDLNRKVALRHMPANPSQKAALRHMPADPNQKIVPKHILADPSHRKVPKHKAVVTSGSFRRQRITSRVSLRNENSVVPSVVTAERNNKLSVDQFACQCVHFFFFPFLYPRRPQFCSCRALN
nr:uncharacterized protein LOC119618900 isoform X2 [Chlorocebus sabaeus]